MRGTNRVYVGGMVSGELKTAFLRELEQVNRAGRSKGSRKVTQTILLRALLAESVNQRRAASLKHGAFNRE